MRKILPLIYLTTSFYTLFTHKLFAQDTIVTLLNETIDVQVIELDYSQELVRFKKNSNPDGPTYSESFSNVFAINILNSHTIYFDPYKNPYPGYQTIVPISMRRLERYSQAELDFAKQVSTSRFIQEQQLANASGVNKIDDYRFKTIFDKIVATTKDYCRSRGFTIADEFDWEYVFVNCLENSVGNCKTHSNYSSLELDNAKSLGHGYFFFSELFFEGQSDDAIAGVVAHEIGHALARHTVEKIRKINDKEKIAHWTAVGVTVAHGGTYNANRNAIEFFGDGFFYLPYSRKLETEADLIGVVLMTLAGYNPEAVIQFWRTGNKATHTQFRSTHPGGIQRAYAIEQFINSPEFQILTKQK